MTADELARILDELGRRLGPTGAHVFDLAVRQVYINGIVSLVLLGVVAIVGIVTIPRAYKWSVADTNPYGDRGMLVVMGGAGYCLVVLLVVINAAVFVPAMLNPEYAALRDLLSAIRPLQ
jgi:hypothetical protein